MTEASLERIRRLEVRLERERLARREAERIAEDSLRSAYLKQEQLTLLERVARLANESRDVEATISETLALVCAFAGWPVARARLLGGGGGLLAEQGAWHPAGAVVPRELAASHGAGLAARVLAGDGAVWAPEGGSVHGEPTGMVLAFPILAGDAVEGVIELFAPAAAAPDQRLIDTAWQVGLQLGRVVERERTEALLHRAHAEQEELLREFGRSNQELEAFAYIASHDLQEPLRTITGFVGLLQRGYADRFDAKAEQYFGFIVDGTERMRGLIGDLLSYSRVGRAELKTENVDLGALVRVARDGLEGLTSETDHEFVIGELPIVRGDPTQLAQVFANLIGNALKFRSQDPPRIRVAAERDENDGGWRLTVEDNGIGIPPEQAEKAFSLFGRLRLNDAEGTGIGLAICQRVMERHGGAITVAPTPGGGSTFTLTLPDRDAQ